MVILKRIIKTNDNISAIYYPEGKEQGFYMKVRLPEGTILEHDGNGNSMAPAHVYRELCRLAQLDDPPKEKTLLWY